MATSNFHNVNATKIYATSFEDEFGYEDFKYDVLEGLKELNKLKGITFYNRLGKDETELRSYPSEVLGTVSKSKHYSNFSVEVELVVVVRSGYYDGVNLDYDINLNIEGDRIDSLSDTIDTLENILDSRKMAEYKGRFAQRFLATAYNELVETVEKVFAEYTDKLVVTARFSNGETLYQKVD